MSLPLRFTCSRSCVFRSRIEEKYFYEKKRIFREKVIKRWFARLQEKFLKNLQAPLDRVLDPVLGVHGGEYVYV